jgi:nicotinate-nucleotide adenylyltransferase
MPASRQHQELTAILAKSRNQANFRLLVFGGSFNPVHNGHLQLAREILRHRLGDAVLFIPAKSPPHKLNLQLASETDRLAMLQLAIAGMPDAYVSDMEFHRPGPSYTIDTLESLRAELPGVQLIFIMGMDSLASLHTWHRARELAAGWQLLIYPRPAIPLPAKKSLDTFFGEVAAARLLASVHELPLFDISSSSIRQAIAAGKSVDHLLPPAVTGYILDKGLYRN